MNFNRHILSWPLIVAAALLVLSCSTTRSLPPDSSRLVSNKVKIMNDSKFSPKELEPYIKQKSQKWSPFLALYNTGGPKNKTIWSKFVHKIGKAPVVYDPSLVESSIDNMKRHLEYIGYYNSEVSADVSVKKRKASVHYSATLGKRYPIKDISLSLPERGEFAGDFLSDTSSVTISKGDYLSEQALEKESDRSAAVMRNKGYFDFTKNHYFFTADTLSFPDSALLELRVNEYTRNETPQDASELRKYKFGTVDLYYPKSLKFRENVLRQLTTVRPGAPYSETAVNSTYSRLSAISIFNNVGIELTPSGLDTADCRISLNQSSLHGFKLNLEASSNSTGLLGLSPELSWYHKNIFHGGEVLNLGFMGNFQFKVNDNVNSTEFGFSAGITFPKFILLPYRLFKGTVPKTVINASYNYQDRPEYTRNIISTSLGFTGSRKSFYYQVYPVQFNVVRLMNIDQKFYESLAKNPFMMNSYQNHFDLGLGGSLYLTDNTDVNPKTDRYFVSLQFKLAGNLLSAFKGAMKKDGSGAGMIWNTPFSQYVRAELSLGKSWRLGKNEKQTIATRFLIGAGHAYGNSSALPFEQHFYAGGANSLRGWQSRGIGPGLSKRDTSFVLPNQTGDMKLEANFEYRFPMFWKFEGAAFIDAGNVWMLHETSESGSESARFDFRRFAKSIAADFGLGIRLDLTFILLRVDLGVPVHDPSRDQGGRWIRLSKMFSKNNYALHFGVGYPF